MIVTSPEAVRVHQAEADYPRPSLTLRSMISLQIANGLVKLQVCYITWAGVCARFQDGGEAMTTTGASSSQILASDMHMQSLNSQLARRGISRTCQN